MKKDIDFPKSKGVFIALAKEENKEDKSVLWNAYIVNELNEPIEKVFVNISAVGKIAGKEKKTTNVRYLIERVEPNSFQQVEPLLLESLKLTNQYWVSYFLENVLYDKKFIFVPGSTNSKNISLVPIVNLQGVYIR